MNNPVKLVIGTFLGAGVGAGIVKAVGSATETVTVGTDSGSAPPRESLRERWNRAQVAGEAARAEKEQELRSYFRTKVKDQQAMRENPTL
jgi:hypothetical protein